MPPRSADRPSGCRDPTAGRSTWWSCRGNRRYAIDARKIERELGWRPAEAFETGLEKTVDWYLDNEAWVAEVTSGAYRDWIKRQYG